MSKSSGKCPPLILFPLNLQLVYEHAFANILFTVFCWCLSECSYHLEFSHLLPDVKRGRWIALESSSILLQWTLGRCMT